MAELNGMSWTRRRERYNDTRRRPRPSLDY